MSDDIETPQSPKKPIQEQNEPELKAEEPSKKEEVDKSTDSSNVEELIKKSTEKDLTKDSVKNIDESYQWSRVSNIYRDDRRSGGNYFQGKEIHVYGDIVGRDLNKNSSVKEVAGQILNEDVEKVGAVYVETDGYKQAISILNEKHLLILHGRQHIGKQTTGIHLLSSLSTEVILEIEPTVEDLSLFQGEANQLYIVDTLATESATKVNRFVRAHLAVVGGVKLPDRNMGK